MYLFLFFIHLCILLFWILYSQTETFHNKKFGQKFHYDVYWINLLRSFDRRHFMNKQFDQFGILNKKIDAYDGKLIYEYSNVDIPDTLKKFKPYIVGATLSHIKAIKEAYEDGLDKVCIMEDDIDLQPIQFWDKNLKFIELDAPKDWQIIQFHISNSKVLQTLIHLEQSFVPWKDGHWSAGFYLINRDGMRHILQLFVNNNIIKLPLLNREIVADFLIFNSCKTYSYTKPLVSHKISTSLIQTNQHVQSSQIPGFKIIQDYFNKIKLKQHTF